MNYDAQTCYCHGRRGAGGAVPGLRDVGRTRFRSVREAPWAVRVSALRTGAISALGRRTLARRCDRHGQSAGSGLRDWHAMQKLIMQRADAGQVLVATQTVEEQRQTIQQLKGHRKTE